MSNKNRQTDGKMVLREFGTTVLTEETVMFKACPESYKTSRIEIKIYVCKHECLPGHYSICILTAKITLH